MYTPEAILCQAFRDLSYELTIGLQVLKDTSSSLKKNGEPLFVKKKHGYLILEGDLDYRSTGILGKYIKMYKPLNGNKYLILDMRDITYLDSAGLGLLIEAQKYLEQEGKRLKIINLKDGPLKVVEIANLKEFLNVQ